MNDTSFGRSSTNLPAWLTEAADVLWARRRLVVAAAVATVIVGVIGAMVAPGLLPPRAIVGAAVGLAAVLLAAAIGLAVDAADLVVRGARHVRAAGADVAATVGKDVRDVGPLMARVGAHAVEGRIRVAVVPASREAGAPGARASSLAEALARTGKRVLVADLARPATPTPGLSEVIAGERRLAEVAHLEEDLYLARVPIGTDPGTALQGLADWVDRLPSDLEVLVLALPPLADPGVMQAAGIADLLLIQVEADRTERVDLIAALDAVDAAGMTGEVVLVDPGRSWNDRGESPAAPLTRGAPGVPEDVPQDEPIDAAGQPIDDLTDEDGELDSLIGSIAGDDTPSDEFDQDEGAVDADVEDSEPEIDQYEQVEDADELESAGAAYDPSATSEIPVMGGAPRDLAHVWDEPEPASVSVVPPVVPDPEPVPLPDPAPMPDPRPIPVPEPTPVPEPGPIPTPIPDPVPVPDPEPAPQPSPMPKPLVSRSPGPPPTEVDELAREAVRTTAALYALAEEVWRREDGE